MPSRVFPRMSSRHWKSAATKLRRRNPFRRQIPLKSPQTVTSAPPTGAPAARWPRDFDALVIDHESELLDHRQPLAFFALDVLRILCWCAGDQIAPRVDQPYPHIISPLLL